MTNYGIVSDSGKYLTQAGGVYQWSTERENALSYGSVEGAKFFSEDMNFNFFIRFQQKGNYSIKHI